MAFRTRLFPSGADLLPGRHEDGRAGDEDQGRHERQPSRGGDAVWNQKNVGFGGERGFQCCRWSIDLHGIARGGDACWDQKNVAFRGDELDGVLSWLGALLLVRRTVVTGCSASKVAPPVLRRVRALFPYKQS